MGYFGGKFDIIFQRIIEIWSNIPFLYVIMIVSSIMVPNFGMLVGIMLLFGWIGMTWYMRTSVYKEKARDYVSAAKALGMSNERVILSTFAKFNIYYCYIYSFYVEDCIPTLFGHFASRLQLLVGRITCAGNCKLTITVDRQ